MDSFERDIFDTPTDNKQAKTENKKLLLPGGWYVTELPTTLTPSVNDEGRRIARYFFTLVNKKNPEIVGKLGLNLSPDYRPHKSGEDKADWNYQNFLKARKAFIKATGSEPTTDAEVVRFLAEYPVALRVTQTDDDENMIVGIDAVQE